MIAIYPIVEGHGEVSAVPLLLRRIVQDMFKRYDVDVLPPHRVPRGRMLAEETRALEDAVELGVRKIRQTELSGLISVLLDAEKDCPADLGRTLLDRIKRSDVATSVVVAKREYEAWFLAGARSLRKLRNKLDTAVAPPNPESIGDAKGYLQRHVLVPGAVYRETVDQPALTAALDLEAARAAPSFDKLCRDLHRLLPAVPSPLNTSANRK